MASGAYEDGSDREFGSGGWNVGLSCARLFIGDDSSGMDVEEGYE